MKYVYIIIGLAVILFLSPKKYRLNIFLATLTFICFIINVFKKDKSKELISALNDQKKKLKDQIKIIDDRINKRKLAYEIAKEKKIELEKNIKHWSDSELDKFINRNL